MPYTPPVGVVALSLGGAPGGTALHLGGGSATNRTGTAWGRGPVSRGFASLRHTYLANAWGRCPAPRGHGTAHYDPNLLSAIHRLCGAPWQQSTPSAGSLREPVRESPALRCGTETAWGPADPLSDARLIQSSGYASIGVQQGGSWTDAANHSGASGCAWINSPRWDTDAKTSWRDAPSETADTPAAWRDLPLLWIARTAYHQQGALAVTHIGTAFTDGASLRIGFSVVWGPGDYPLNARRPGPPIEPPGPPPWGAALRLCAPLPGTRLTIGARCPAWPWINLPRRKSYLMRHSITLVRLPDRTPLPVTQANVSTDSDSWSWVLSGALFGPDAWELVRPQPPAYLPIEVELSIDGWTWQFVLEQTNQARKFSSNSVSIGGRSRSAWLSAPYLAATSGVVGIPRTAQQIAEDALADTGWSLDWGLADWLVPAGLLAYAGTPIERLQQILAPVSGCLYTDPSAAILTAYPRYPLVPWLWDTHPADVGIPESALLSWSREPDHQPAHNGVYVSGTEAGVLAFCKLSGTAGDLLADQVVDPLISDPDGIAARARAEAVLSASGPGALIAADTLLTPNGSPGPGLIRPGLLVELDGIKGVVRSTRIGAQWTEGLTVRQSLTIERREVEQ